MYNVMKKITADMLLAPCEGERTATGMRANIRVAVQYILKRGSQVMVVCLFMG